MLGRPLVRWAALVTLIAMPSPAFASDFTALRVIVFGAYYLLVLPVCFFLCCAAPLRKGSKWANLLAALFVAALFAPSVTWPPNHLIASPLVLLVGGQLERPLLAMVSFIATAFTVWGLLELSSRNTKSV